jgi:hypothetical protein
VSARGAIEKDVLAWMREPEWRDDEARFSALALRLFAFQFEHCAPWRRFCRGRGRTPEGVDDWRDVPPVPTGAFKEVALRCFPAERTLRTFTTSGTSMAARGALHLDTLELYEASLLPAFRRHLLPEAGRLRLLVLAPSPDEAPESSLSQMFGTLLHALGAAGSGFYVANGRFETGRLVAELGASSEPVGLCGTAFALVHLLEALERADLRLALPPGSRVMETGGFKGRSRELPRDALYATIEQRLGIGPARIVNQYGMTELGSQFYDSVLREPDAPRRKLAPPWTRVRVLDPETGDDARPGDVGPIAVYDLANTGSVLAVQTADLGRRLGDGFELLGREPGAEERGCSIAVDELIAKPTA